MDPDSSPPLFSRPQRWVALAYGLLGHALFAAAVAVMFVTLYQGLHVNRLHLHGALAFAVNALLVLQFAAGHSFLLSDRGRRFMARLAPLDLGRALSTTIFAALASLQLLVTFLLWSASDTLWCAPHGWIKAGLSVAYGISWLLLAKSMHDAGFDTQLGTIGWHSVWRGRHPAYRPFARTGLFRYSRQPIYLSFTLILWTAPVWTPDHLLIALLWTAYCVAAPLMKEQRYRRYYGGAFARYQRLVPYWLPFRFPRASAPPPPAPAASPPNTRSPSSAPGRWVFCLLVC